MKRFQRLLERESARRVLAIIAALLTLQTTLFTFGYAAAWRYLREHDPRKVENLWGISYYAKPKRLFIGLELTREELAAYLDMIGYQNRLGAEAGTFSLDGNALCLNARLPEFESATIFFRGRRIQAIQCGEESVSQLEIEPPTLLNVIRQLKDERLHSMNARRIVLSEDEVMRSHLYPVTVCAEDRRFATHSGIDELGTLAALLIRRKGGGSTLIQQLIKNAVLSDVSTGFSLNALTRKIKEAFLALAASRLMTRAEIFTAFSNHCPLGDGEKSGTLVLYGFGAASRELFGVETTQLTLGQAAAIAAIIRLPNHYLRLAREGNYEDLLRRRARILEAVQEQFADRYTPAMIAQAKAEPLAFLFVSESETEKPLDLISRHFQRFAAAQARSQSELNFGRAESTRVYLTLDPDLQTTASRAVRAELQRLDPLVAAARRRQGVSAEDSEPVQAALVAMDTQTGEILALVGSRGEEEFNYATAVRSPGSAAKPFVYLTALTEGWLHGKPFTAATILHPRTDPVDDYRPKNHPGEIASARRNLAISGNAAACVVGHSAGLGHVRACIERFTEARSRELTGMLSIGGSAGSEVSVVNLTAGYAALANGGLKLTPTAFSAIHQSGVGAQPTAMPRSVPTRVAAAAPVYVVTQMLRDVLQPGGTGARALPLAGVPHSGPIAAKTGTGQVADLWFCGYTPKLAACVWVGMPKNQPKLGIKDGFDGARAALPIWAAFIREGLKKHRPDLLAGEFERPAEVKILRVNEARGCQADDPQNRAEYFVAGREPEPCAKR